MEEIQVKVKKSAKPKKTEEVKEEVNEHPIGWHEAPKEEHQSETIIHRNEEKQPSRAGKYFRRIFSSFFGILGVVLLLLSLLALWSNRVVTDQAAFSKAVSPLITDHAIQVDLSTKLTDQILDNAPQADLVTALLPGQNISKKSTTEIKNLLKPEVYTEVYKVISSKGASALWESTVKTAQEQTLEIAKSNVSGEAVLDLSSSVAGFQDLLKGSPIDFLKGADIATDAGKVKLTAEQVKSIQDTYRIWNMASLALIAAAVVSLVLAIIISIKRRRTTMWLALATSVVIAPLLMIATAFDKFKKPEGTTQADWDSIKSIYRITTVDLKTYSSIIFGLAVATFVITLVYPFVRSRMGKRKSGKKPAEA